MNRLQDKPSTVTSRRLFLCPVAHRAAPANPPPFSPDPFYTFYSPKKL